MNVKEIGERIKQARLFRNYTLNDIAQDIGVAKSTIQRYEKGLIATPKLPVLQAIAHSLKINSEWLLGQDVPMIDPDIEYWENQTKQDILYHEFLHNYFDYESPYTLDGNVDIIINSDPDVTYRVSAKEYDDFYEFLRNRIDNEFSILKNRAKKTDTEPETLEALRSLYKVHKKR